MSDIVATDKIEKIVGAKRRTTEHLGRAVSASETVFILHSKECMASVADLRDCPYSLALDRGITGPAWWSWRSRQDRAVLLSIDGRGWLLAADLGSQSA